LTLIVAALCLGTSAPSMAAEGCTIPTEALAPPERLFHGTSREGFTPAGRNAGLWQFPPGPAWFAPERDFSLHAPLRYPQAEVITLFAYRPARPLTLLYCDTADAAADYAETRGLAHHRKGSDPAVAAAICDTRRRPLLDGYRIQADRVRGETEYVICQPHRVLDLVQSRFWQVQPRRLDGLPGRSATLGRQGVWLQQTDLTCFVRLPQDRGAACPERGTKPHRGCCRSPS
jgi:hypothetical protein